MIEDAKIIKYNIFLLQFHWIILLTIMDESALGVNSLYDLTIKQICQSMDENTLVNVIKSFHPAMSLDIMWKVGHFFFIRNCILLKVLATYQCLI